MKLIIHDLDITQFETLFLSLDEGIEVISNNDKIRHCTGCFGCWIKTPGVCVLKDAYNEMGKKFAQASEIICISKCTYGGYSSFVKNVWDRSLPYILPFFLKKNGETHHKQRYKEQFVLTVYFYGSEITLEEQSIAKELIAANALNFDAKKWEVSFYKSITELSKGVCNL